MPVQMGVACAGRHGFIVHVVMVLVAFSVNVLANMLKQLVHKRSMPERMSTGSIASHT